MLEEKPEYKKRKKYTKRRQQVIRQLFFTGVAVVVVIIGCATWALKSDNMARKTDIQAKTSQTGRKADAAKTSVENGVQAKRRQMIRIHQIRLRRQRRQRSELQG